MYWISMRKEKISKLLKLTEAFCSPVPITPRLITQGDYKENTGRGNELFAGFIIDMAKTTVYASVLGSLSTYVL